MQSYKTNDFIKLLSEDRLKNRLSIECIVKTDDDQRDMLMISPSGSCDKWIPVPHDAIESIDYLQMKGCKDHQHPFVQLNLKDPPKDNHIAHLYLDLFKTAQANVAPVMTNEVRSIRGIPRQDDNLDVCLGAYSGPCEKQQDGSYWQWRKSSDTGCEEVRVPCIPKPVPLESFSQEKLFFLPAPIQQLSRTANLEPVVCDTATVVCRRNGTWELYAHFENKNTEADCSLLFQFALAPNGTHPFSITIDLDLSAAGNGRATRIGSRIRGVPPEVTITRTGTFLEFQNSSY